MLLPGYLRQELRNRFEFLRPSQTVLPSECQWQSPDGTSESLNTSRSGPEHLENRTVIGRLAVAPPLSSS